MPTIVVMTAEQQAAEARKSMKRAVKGTDVRCHNGARPIVHRRHNEYKRFGGKEKRELLRSMDQA